MVLHDEQVCEAEDGVVVIDVSGAPEKGILVWEIFETIEFWLSNVRVEAECGLCLDVAYLNREQVSFWWVAPRRQITDSLGRGVYF